MSNEKKILDFDKNELFVSSRVCEFVLDNALKTNLSEEMSKAAMEFVKTSGLYKQSNSIYPFDLLAQLIEICRKANTSNEQFYTIGNKSHDLHVLVSSSTNPGIDNPIDWGKELNIIRMTLQASEFKLTTSIELHQSILIDHKKIFEPVFNILKGFIDRIYGNVFDAKPELLEKKSGFILSHSSFEVSNINLVRLISNEQFAYSRLLNFLAEEQEESITEKISFFLFKDIGFSVEEIALKLNISVRSLQRKLKEEQANFRSIKELVRKELSIKYLKDKTLSINDICLLLSYSERGVFEKAFKKWYGKNPSEYKKELG